MSKELVDKKMHSKIANHGTRRPFKVFAVNFHGPDLEVTEKVLAKEMEVDSRRKILAVMVKENDVGEDFFADEPSGILQIVDDIQKCEKDFESLWQTLSSELEGDLRKYWTGALRKRHETVNIIPRKIRDADMQVMNAKIDGIDLSICDFYIVIFGRLSTNQLVELVRTNIPLQAIIHFIPCPEADLEVNFPKLRKDIDFLKKSPFTKNVGIFIESLMTATEYLHEKYSNDIYDQLTWYLYDIEMLAQQFAAYQTDFVEINDEATTSSSQEQLSLPKALVEVEWSTKDDAAAAVGVYLDNLCNTIEHPTDMDRRYSLSHVRPFLENNYDRIIVEEANELLRSALASQMDMVSYWRIVDLMLKSSVASERVGATKMPPQLPPFYEVLSWESFVQRLTSARRLYDECCCVDLTEACQIYILRRTLHNIVEKKAIFRLPTKLGFRDFCEYLAPGWGDIFNQDQSGLAFDDTLHELSATVKVYRFEDGFIRCTFDKWRHNEPSLSLEIQLFENSVFVHRWEAYKAKFSKIRVLTRNGIACDVEMPDNLDCPDISIHWPSDCQIRHVRDGKAHAVEQRHQGLRRLFTKQGCVIVYLPNDTIEVLTPNGVAYKLYPNSHIHDESEPSPVFTNVVEELDFVKSLQSYGIDCKHFDVTRPDGRKLRVFGESVVEGKDHFLIYEWTDYNENECYADRDDGVKMIWSYGALRCHYPCGTVITTTVVEEAIEMNFECRSKSTENILRKINPTLVDRVANKAKRHDTYITYNVNYLMQHKNYASVCFCGKDKIVIYSPDEFKLVFKVQHLVLIDIGETLSFRITAGVCTIATGVSMPDDKQILLRLDLCPDVEEIIYFQRNHASLRLHKNGEMVLTRDEGGLTPYQDELVLLAKRNKFGMAFISNEKYSEIAKNSRNEIYSYDTASKFVQFKPILPIDEQFCMAMPEIDRKLEHFKTSCQRGPKKPNDLMERRVLSARVIHKLESIPNDICRLIQNFNFTEATLASYITDALDHYFGKKIKATQSPKWKTKIDTIKRDFNFKNQRMTVYNAMLRQNIFPKYHEFLKCNGDLKLIDVNKF